MRDTIKRLHKADGMPFTMRQHLCELLVGILAKLENAPIVADLMLNGLTFVITIDDVDP